MKTVSLTWTHAHCVFHMRSRVNSHCTRQSYLFFQRLSEYQSSEACKTIHCANECPFIIDLSYSVKTNHLELATQQCQGSSTSLPGTQDYSRLNMLGGLVLSFRQLGQTWQQQQQDSSINLKLTLQGSIMEQLSHLLLAPMKNHVLLHATQKTTKPHFKKQP